MPCTAKKNEASRKEMKINGLFPVDYVITTRELSFMLKKSNIDLAKIKPAPADSPFGEFSGGGAIYGGTGGVMESALRTAQFYAYGDNERACDDKIEFIEARGMAGVKEARVKIAKAELRIAVVNGIGNVKPVLDNLKNYDYVEVMACPGGCIGGGGQPIPTTPEIRQKRIAALYEIDKNCAIRKSYENKGVMEMIKWSKEQKKKMANQLFYTNYKRK